MWPKKRSRWIKEKKGNSGPWKELLGKFLHSFIQQTLRTGFWIEGNSEKLVLSKGVQLMDILYIALRGRTTGHGIWDFDLFQLSYCRLRLLDAITRASGGMKGGL